MPFSKNNILIVNRVVENVINDTKAGALRTLSAYMDWAPVTIGGELGKGNMITMGMDSSKNVGINFTTDTLGEYVFTVGKGNPFNSPPINAIKKVAVASFIIRGNLEATDISIGNGWKTTTTKWFPGLTEATWPDLVEAMYKDFETKTSSELGYEILPIDQVVNSEAYKHAKAIEEGVKGNFVEVGAGGTKRIVSTRSTDFWKDASITFGSDFISERLVKELGVDAVISVVIDLNLNYDTDALDPKVNIVSFAPNMGYKTGAKYFTMNATGIPKSLKDVSAKSGSTSEVIYNLVNAKTLSETFIDALKQLQAKEDGKPVYETLWKANL
jgi:hypothetical protein